MLAWALRVTDTQTFTVSPDGDARLTVGVTGENQRQYTVSGAVADTDHQIVLFDAGNVDVDANGFVTFDAVGPTGVNATRAAADITATQAEITVVNGASTTGSPFAIEDVQPVGTQITFTVQGNALSDVVPVVYFDENEDGFLNVDADGAPVDAELFGVGGAVEILPAEADSANFTANEVLRVNKDENFVVVENVGTVNYAAGDTFFVDGTAAGDQVDLDGFEERLARGDLLAATPYSRNFASSFELTDQVPGQVADVDASTADTEGAIDVTWAEKDNASEYNIYRATATSLANDGAADSDLVVADEARFSRVATVPGDADDLEFEDTGLANETSYVYWVTAVVDGVEGSFVTGDVGDPAFSAGAFAAFDVAATLAEGATVRPIITESELTDDVGLQGILDDGDEWTITFNQAMAPSTATAGVFIVTNGSNNATINCAETGGNATCELTDEVASITGAETLTVTVDDAPNFGSGDSAAAGSYPLTIVTINNQVRNTNNLVASIANSTDLVIN